GTHLADHDHIRRLAQRVLQRGFPAVGVDADFALGDDAAIVLVHEFDRVLDGDDVARGIHVAVADHRRERSGLAGTGGAHEQDDAALGHRQGLDDRRQAQFLDRRDLGLDPAQHHADLVALVEAGHAEAADAGHADGEVALVRLLELLALRRRHHVEHQVAALLRRERALRDRRQLAVHLHGRRHAGGDEQVRGLLMGHQFQERGEIDAAAHVELLRNARAPKPSGGQSNSFLSLAYSRACGLVTRPRLTRSCRHWSRVCMPTFWPVWMDEYICATLSSRIRFRMAGMPTMISCAAMRPPPTFFSSDCEITARSDSDSIERTIGFSPAGNTSMMRSMVLAAEEVCTVANTRWPVSAAVSASRTVSRSRSSPTRM